MEEQIYRFSGQIKQSINKIFGLLQEKDKKIQELSSEVERLKKIEEDQKKRIEQLEENEFLSSFGGLKNLSSDKKQEFINEIEELIRAIDEISKKIIKKK
jgi:uncharacterized coiled-coil DUF342 family protein